jgi:hypothetical protein
MNTLELRQSTVKPLFRALIRPILPPSIVRLIRFQLWYVSSYLPRLVTSRIVKRTPQVRSFGAVRIPSLAEQLQNVNGLGATKMCRVMTKWGSDKGRAHNYTTVYSALFEQWYNRPLVLLELGLGTNNSEVPSNMGVFGAPGASLRGWRNLFPHARVYGADVDRSVLFQEDRIKTFYCNQLDPASIRELWSNPVLRDGADIIIEDGLHTFEANVSFLEGSLQHLHAGGIYITEDIMGGDVEKWYERLETVYSKKYPNYEFALLVLPHGNRDYNNLLVVRRDAD